MTDALNQELAKMNDTLAVKARLTKAETLLRQLYVEHQSLRDRLFESQVKLTQAEGNARYNSAREERANEMEVNLAESAAQMLRLQEAYTRLEERYAASVETRMKLRRQLTSESEIADIALAKLTRIPNWVRRLFGALLSPKDFLNANPSFRSDPSESDDSGRGSGGERGEDGSPICGIERSRAAADVRARRL
jgi:hypothetical protein